MNELSVAEVAYLAGIIDGEGHIGIASAPPRAGGKSPSHTLFVRVGSTDPRLVDWLQSRLGGHVFSREWPGTRQKTAHLWNAKAALAEKVCELALPYLVIKREQAEIALAFRRLKRSMVSSAAVRPVRGRAWQLSEAAIADREALKQRLNVLNRRGQEIA